MRIQEFTRCESGAIAVDWVVMSATAIGMGLAAIQMTSAGVEDTSRDIADALAAQIDTAFALATEGMTATDIWNDPTVSSKELKNVEQFSFATEVDFSADAEGIIFETGGGVWGTVLYQHDGMLYLQAGRGNGTGEASNRGEASWRVVDGPATIEGSLNSDGGLALMVNGEVVDQSSFTSSRLAGGNPGSIAGSNDNVAQNRGGFNRHSDGHPGVEEVVFFEGQTTGDELAPVN